MKFIPFPVGLDAAGKTTILYKLKLGEIVTTIPTIGELTTALHNITNGDSPRDFNGLRISEFTQNF